MKVTIVKQTGETEQMQVEVQGSVESVLRDLPAALTLADERLWQQAQRILAVNERHRKLAATNPEAYQAVLEAYEMLTGRRQPPNAITRPPQTPEEATLREALDAHPPGPVPETGVTA